MCGIFGIISQRGIERQQFVQLAELNKHRGNLAFGGVAFSADEMNIFRYPAPFSPEMVPQAAATTLLGHIRAATGRRTNELSDVHPFISKNGLLAHNGLLLNHTQFPEWQLDTAVAVDSQIILGGIQSFLQSGLSTVAAIQQTVEKLDGQQACWYWSTTERQLYLWRVMAPIYVSQSNEGFVFSSVPNEWANNLIPEGTIFCLDSQQYQLQARARFSFYSPYQVR